MAFKSGPAHNCTKCKGKPKKSDKFSEDSVYVGTFCSDKDCMKVINWDIKEKQYVQGNKDLMSQLDAIDTEENGISKGTKKKKQPVTKVVNGQVGLEFE